MPKGSSVSELQKKRKKNPLIGSKNNRVTAGEQNKTSVRNKNLNVEGGKGKTSTKKMTGKERAQAMAKKRIASGKTIAEVKAANKLKIKKRAAEKYAAFKKKKNKKK